MPNFNRSRKVWHDHIVRWNGGKVDNGVLIRNNVRRPCTIAMSSYSPRERAGLQIDGVVRFMISALNVSEANVPDPDVDTIQFAGKIYKIVMKPQNPMPDGTFIAFDTPCLEIGAA